LDIYHKRSIEQNFPATVEEVISPGIIGNRKIVMWHEVAGQSRTIG
jgi:hypothetical protein